MTFGEDFGKFLTNRDYIRVVSIFRDQYGMSFSEIAKEIGVRREAIYHWSWEMVSDLDDDNKARLLDLFYKKDRIAAISFVRNLLEDYAEFLDREKMRILERMERMRGVKFEVKSNSTTEVVYTSTYSVTPLLQEGQEEGQVYAIKVL